MSKLAMSLLCVCIGGLSPFGLSALYAQTAEVNGVETGNSVQVPAAQPFQKQAIVAPAVKTSFVPVVPFVPLVPVFNSSTFVVTTTMGSQNRLEGLQPFANRNQSLVPPSPTIFPEAPVGDIEHKFLGPLFLIMGQTHRVGDDPAFRAQYERPRLAFVFNRFTIFPKFQANFSPDPCKKKITFGVTFKF